MTFPILPRRRVLLAAAAAWGALSAAPLAMAQGAWPNKPVRIIVPFAPGGTTDILARALAPELTRAFGQSFVVENRAGAGGNIGAEAASKSPPDGYTLLMGTVGTHGINRALYDKLPYDPIKDFVPISLVAAVPNVMVMNADKAKALGINNVRDFVRHAKANPVLETMAEVARTASATLGLAAHDTPDPISAAPRPPGPGPPHAPGGRRPPPAPAVHGRPAQRPGQRR